MTYFMTLGNVYYEAEEALNIDDVEVTERPSTSHDWDGSTWVFTFDAQGLKQYRDQYIEQDITYNGMTVTNTNEERSALSTLLQSWMTDKTLASIKFKHNDGVSDAGFDDLQGLLKSCFYREQVGRSAEAVVLANHANTPYTTMQEAYDDFDEEV